jgi:predicted transcriptional regulator
MSLLDDILQQLADSGPASAPTLAVQLERDPAVVARMLGKLRADGRVTLDDDGAARIAGARRRQPAPPRSPRTSR